MDKLAGNSEAEAKSWLSTKHKKAGLGKEKRMVNCLPSHLINGMPLKRRGFKKQGNRSLEVLCGRFWTRESVCLDLSFISSLPLSLAPAPASITFIESCHANAERRYRQKMRRAKREAN
ncbi:hypothetical protein WR25_01656 [Diploscapter pachys]|uniref:Uncharacterized protein n=1 Tax=Diploscapter pachys TaxID=2018661 RepID=A0A2A2JSL1_9BILA|nr:hypothetical protein WR25_01656 [Diploscapter pachys]